MSYSSIGGVMFKGAGSISVTNGVWKIGGLALTDADMKKLKQLGLKEIDVSRPDYIRGLLGQVETPEVLAREREAKQKDDAISTFEHVAEACAGLEDSDVVDLVRRHAGKVTNSDQLLRLLAPLSDTYKVDVARVVMPNLTAPTDGLAVVQACARDTYKVDMLRIMVKSDGFAPVEAHRYLSGMSDTYKVDVVRVLAGAASQKWSADEIYHCLSIVSSDTYRVDVLRVVANHAEDLSRDMYRLLSCISSDTYRVDALRVLVKTTGNRVSRASDIQNSFSRSYADDARRILAGCTDGAPRMGPAVERTGIIKAGDDDMKRAIQASLASTVANKEKERDEKEAMIRSLREALEATSKVPADCVRTPAGVVVPRKFPTSKAVDGQPECGTCLENTPNARFDPCGHGGYCMTCAVRALQDTNHCLNCRAVVGRAKLLFT